MGPSQIGGHLIPHQGGQNVFHPQEGNDGIHHANKNHGPECSPDNIVHNPAKGFGILAQRAIRRSEDKQNNGSKTKKIENILNAR